MVKREKFDHLYLIYHFMVPLTLAINHARTKQKSLVATIIDFCIWQGASPTYLWLLEISPSTTLNWKYFYGNIQWLLHLHCCGKLPDLTHTSLKEGCFKVIVFHHWYLISVSIPWWSQQTNKVWNVWITSSVVHWVQRTGYSLLIILQ